MRSLTALLVASSLLAAPLRARADGPSAASMLDTARQLASRGHCDEALRLRPIVERLDPELARSRFASDPSIAACLAGTAPPAAPVLALGSDGEVVPKAQEPPVPPEPPEPCKQAKAYIEPSIFVAAGSPGFGELQRIAAGLEATDCDRAGDAGMSFRIGGTGSARVGRMGFGASSGGGGGSLYGAAGGELEVDLPLGGSRIGARIGYELYYGSMLTAGVRWRTGSIAVAVDGFFSQSDTSDVMPQSTNDGGVMAGFSFDGHPGPVGFAGFLLAAGLVALVGASAAGGN